MPITTPNAGDPWTTQGGQIITALNNFEGADAEYNTATNQTIGAGSGDVAVLFGTDNRTSSLVTKSTYGAGHKFTLNRTGLWMFSTTVRWMFNESGGTATAGERFVRIFHVTPAVVLASSGVVQGTFVGPTTLNTSVYRFMTSGDIVAVTVYHDATSARTLESNNGGAYGRVNLAWLHV